MIMTNEFTDLYGPMHRPDSRQSGGSLEPSFAHLFLEQLMDTPVGVTSYGTREEALGMLELMPLHVSLPVITPRSIEEQIFRFGELELNDRNRAFTKIDTIADERQQQKARQRAEAELSAPWVIDPDVLVQNLNMDPAISMHFQMVGSPRESLLRYRTDHVWMGLMPIVLVFEEHMPDAILSKAPMTLFYMTPLTDVGQVYGEQMDLYNQATLAVIHQSYKDLWKGLVAREIARVSQILNSSKSFPFQTIFYELDGMIRDLDASPGQLVESVLGEAQLFITEEESARLSAGARITAKHRAKTNRQRNFDTQILPAELTVPQVFGPDGIRFFEHHAQCILTGKPMITIESI